MLKVWLPLDGDLRNLGCSDVEVTNNGATIDNNGKIGKCYSFNGSNNYLLGSPAQLSNDSNEWSFCCWFKPNNSHQGTLFCNRTAIDSTGIMVLYCGSTFLIDDGGRWKPSSSAVQINQWNHIAVTVKRNEKKCLYLNGVLINSTTTTSTPTIANATHFTIGGSQSSNTSATGNWFNGYINDVRIYDHCLSAAEVREIAMGLVLHYKLDKNKSQLANVYSYPTFDTSGSNGGWSHWGQSGASGAYGQNTDKKYIWNKNNTYSHWVSNSSSATGHYLLYQSPAFDGGYRSAQCIIKEENGLPITTSIVYAAWNARSDGLTNNTFSSITHLGDGFYLCKAEGIKQDGSNDLVGFCVKPGYKVYFSEAYLENNKEMCSDVFEQDNLTIIEDSSGYGHNGAITGNMSITTDTPRYSFSSNYNNSYIDTNIEFNTTDSTISMWLNIPSLSTSYHILDGRNSSGIGKQPIYSYSNGSIQSGGSSAYVTSSTGFLETNKWIFVALVQSGNSLLLYKNGTLFQTISCTNSSIIKPTIGARYSHSNIYTGKISDFRIYCTALSAADIKQLYEVGAKIDNKQNLHTYEFNENNSNIFSSIPWTNSYSIHSSTSSLFSNYNVNGEPQFTVNGTSAGTNYITIVPGTYRYDYTISVNTGNQFYIGFERYDENKTSRSNNACVYIYSTKPSSDVIKQRYTGTVNLSTDGTNPIKYITLRILNGWSGTTSGVTGQATIHNFSLKLVSSISSPKLKKTGEFIIDELKENTKASFYQDGIVEANNLIEF